MSVPSANEMHTALAALRLEIDAVGTRDLAIVEIAREALSDSIRRAPVNVLLIFMEARIEAMKWVYNQQLNGSEV